MAEVAAWSEGGTNGDRTEGVRRNRTPLGVQVAGLIRDQINRSGLASGDPLPSESQLAEEYGVSQRVVRDALRTLNNDGIIETRQGKRAIVSDLRPVAVGNYFRFAVDADADAVDDLMELRLLLEVRVAELAAEHATEAEIARMRRLLTDVQETGTDLQLRVPADLALHAAVAEASGNRFYHGILEALGQTLAEERRRGGEITQSHGDDHAETNAQHTALVNAIAAHDPRRAGKAARAIVDRARAILSDEGGD